MMCNRQRCLQGAVGMALLSAGASAQPIVPIALTGQQAAGQAPGVVYQSFAIDPVINNQGRVAFRAFVAGPGITVSNNSGLWVGRPFEAVQLRLQAGQAVAGTGGALVFSNGEAVTSPGPVLNDAGTVLLRTQVTEVASGQPYRGLVRVGAGQAAQLLARDNATAPGTMTPIASSGLRTFALSASSEQLHFSAGLSDTTFATWTSLGAPLMRTTFALPGLALAPTGLDGSEGSNSPVTVTSAGTTALALRFANNSRSLWTNTFSSGASIAASGQAVPGSATQTFVSFDVPSVNNAGNVAFGAALSMGSGVFRSDGGQLVTLARTGQAAPLVGPDTLQFGTPFRTFGALRPVVCNDGTVLFIADIAGPGVGPSNDTVLWRSRPGQGTTAVAREGNALAGDPLASTLGAPTRYTATPGGRVAILTTLNVPGEGQRVAILRESLQGLLTRVVKVGDVITGTSRGDLTIQSLAVAGSASGGEDGVARWMTSAGEITFLAGFVDSQNAQGTGIFIARSPLLCDSIDFNNDQSVFDPQDIDALLSVYSEGPCVPVTATCNDVDFNNDGSLFDPCDITAFLVIYAEGPCTACGA